MQSLQILNIKFVLRAEKVAIFSAEMAPFPERNTKHRKTTFYVFYNILQPNFINFKMLFLGVVIDLIVRAQV